MSLGVGVAVKSHPGPDGNSSMAVYTTPGEPPGGPAGGGILAGVGRSPFGTPYSA